MSALKEVIKMLIEAKQKGSAKLPRGLVLAYTPTVRGDSVDHRLVWSRKGSQPSAAEDKILESHFLAALNELGIPKPKVVQKDFQISLSPGWGSSLLVLRTGTVIQEALFE